MKQARQLCCIALVTGFALTFAPAANAQAGRATTGTSSGMNSLGGSSGGLSGSNSFGGGTNRFSTTNANQSNANQSVFQNQQSSFGLQNPAQQNGFLGGANGQNFLGANQRNQTNNQQQQNQFGNRGGRNQLNQMGMNDPNSFGQQGTNTQDPRRSIRPQQKVAFEIPIRPATEIHSDLQTRMTTIANNPNLRGIVVDLDYDGVATLSGEVNTSSQKRLAENIVRLEPGIKRTRNELKVRDPFADR